MVNPLLNYFKESILLSSDIIKECNLCNSAKRLASIRFFWLIWFKILSNSTLALSWYAIHVYLSFLSSILSASFNASSVRKEESQINDFILKNSHVNTSKYSFAVSISVNALISVSDGCIWVLWINCNN